MTASSRKLIDHLEVLLRNGKAPSLDMLLALVPDEPAMDVEDFDWGTPMSAGARVIALHSRAATELPTNVHVTKYVSIATFRRQYWAGKTPPALRISDRRLGWRVKDLLENLAKRADAAA